MIRRVRTRTRGQLLTPCGQVAVTLATVGVLFLLERLFL